MNKEELKIYRNELDELAGPTAVKEPYYRDCQNLFLLAEAIYQRHGRFVMMTALSGIMRSNARSSETSPDTNFADNFKELDV